MRLQQINLGVTPVSEKKAPPKTLRLGGPTIVATSEEAIFGFGRKTTIPNGSATAPNKMTYNAAKEMRVPHFARGYTATQEALTLLLKSMPGMPLALGDGVGSRIRDSVNGALNIAFATACNNLPAPGSKYMAWSAWASSNGEALTRALEQTSKYVPKQAHGGGNDPHAIIEHLKGAIQKVLAEAREHYNDEPPRAKPPVLGLDLSKFKGYTDKQTEVIAFLLKAGTVTEGGPAAERRVETVKQVLETIPEAGSAVGSWKLWAGGATKLMFAVLDVKPTEKSGFLSLRTVSEKTTFERLIGAMLVDTQKSFPNQEVLPSPNAGRLTPVESERPAMRDITPPPATLKLSSPEKPTGTSLALPSNEKQEVLPPSEPAQPQRLNVIDLPSKPVSGKPRKADLIDMKDKGKKAHQELKKMSVQERVNKAAQRAKQEAQTKARFHTHLGNLVTQHVVDKSKERLSNGAIIAHPKTQKLMKEVGITSERQMHRIINDIRKVHRIAPTNTGAKKSAKGRSKR